MSTSDGNSTTRPVRRRQSKRFDRSGRAPVATGSTIISDDDVELDPPEPVGEANGGTAEAEAVAAAPMDGADQSPTSDPDDGDEPVETVEPAGSIESLESAETVESPEAADTSGSDDPVESAETASPQPERRSPISPVVDDRPQSAPADPTARNRTLDEMTPCGRCGHDVSTVQIEVDDNVLMMESCDNCDTRRWQLAGQPIELQQALDHVGEHTGRRR